MTVLTGGSSPERDVALAGAAEVVKALRAAGHTVSVVDTVTGPLSPDRQAALLTGAVDREPPTPEELRSLRERELGPAMVDLPELRGADVVFPVLHGRQGEGGELQALLQLAGIPFTGSDALGSAIAMAKDVAKGLLRNAGITTPDWAMWPSSPEETAALGLPLVVKPSRVGSTIGLSVIDSLGQLEDAVAVARDYDDDILLETFIRGRELTVGILGNTALAVGEIIPDHAHFDYECKYTPGLTQEIFPADLDGATTAALQATALAAHRVLKLRDSSRIDFIQTSSGTAYCLEANTLPGLTRTSLLPQSAEAAGIPFPELCAKMCDLALDRHHGTKAAC
ncbi:MAG: D-alanine--D-alanine ligase [Gemmatimonadetes bacterium]|nr:D-alanine--D-alanine ligase [Gemmatimonadota bacterium]